MSIKGIYNFIKTACSKHSAHSALKKDAEESLFCRQYWKQRADKNLLTPLNKTSVSLHEELNGINHFFISGANPKYMDSIFNNSGLTPRDMIKRADTEFKRLNPTEETLNVFRCIGEKPDFFSEYKLYQKRLNTNSGDIINMREYAYATSDISYAKVYMPSKKGILYEIEIPKGSKISRKGTGKNDEVVFPRSSKFECINTQKVQNGDESYTKIKLRYLPEENIVD